MNEQAVRFYLLIGVVVLLLIVSLFVKKKMKIILSGIIILCVSAFMYNELTMDQRISMKYKEYEQLVVTHLDETYPHERWELTYDASELSDLWGYEFYIVFENEPLVTYSYTIENARVIQAHASTDIPYENFKHNQ